MQTNSCDTGICYSARGGGGAWLAVILLIGLQPLAGATSCDPDCTPENPDYDPVTGLCSQPAEGQQGPPVPGSGGLPTEPNTPTTQPAPDHDPDAVDLGIYGLNGRWMDGAYEACIEHNGSAVSAIYTELRECDHADGTGTVSLYDADFEGELVGDTITGTTVTCKFGFDAGENGLISSPLTLTVSEDGKTLSGTWYSEVDDADIEIMLTRESVGDCQPPG